MTGTENEDAPTKKKTSSKFEPIRHSGKKQNATDKSDYLDTNDGKRSHSMIFPVPKDKSESNEVHASYTSYFSRLGKSFGISSKDIMDAMKDPASVSNCRDEQEMIRLYLERTGYYPREAVMMKSRPGITICLLLLLKKEAWKWME